MVLCGACRSLLTFLRLLVVVGDGDDGVGDVVTMLFEMVCHFVVTSFSTTH